MIPSKLITKENAKKRLEQRGKDFMAIFVSGSNINPNPKLYKYYWWIYSMESKEKSGPAFCFRLLDFSLVVLRRLLRGDSLHRFII